MLALALGMTLGAGLGTSVLASRMIVQGGGISRDAVGGPPERREPSPPVQTTESKSAAGGSLDVTRDADTPWRTITARDLAKRIDDAGREKTRQEMAILDGNSREAFSQARIPGAVHLADETLDASKLPVDKRAFLAFVCDRVRIKRCEDAARRATELGYKDVVVIPDANSGWRKLGKTLEHD